MEFPARLNRVVESIKRDPDLNEGIEALKGRNAFNDDLTTTLVGIGLVPEARAKLETAMTDMWATTHAKRLPSGYNEIVIGAGVHAAVYCAVRARMGKPKPLVIDMSDRVGGTFAMTDGPAFWLNSRNRPGPADEPGSQGALNVLPGAPIQPSMLSNAEYQKNDDLAFIVRLTLAMTANVRTGHEVTGVIQTTLPRGRQYPFNAYQRLGFGVYFVSDNGRRGTSKIFPRVIVAQGIKRLIKPAGDMVMNFPEFMQWMTSNKFPLRNMQRIAVVGDGDSGRCAIESVFGMAPGQHWSIPDLDRPYVDWYAPNTYASCTDYLTQSRTRYKRIGALLPRTVIVGGPRGSLLRVLNEGASAPSPRYDTISLNGRTYDLIVWCTGPGAYGTENPTGEFMLSGNQPIARNYNGSEGIGMAIGPCAQIPFDDVEANRPYAAIIENVTALWRLTPRTAALAAMLP